MGCVEFGPLAERRRRCSSRFSFSEHLWPPLRRPEALTQGSSIELPPTSTRLLTNISSRMRTCKTRSRGTRQRLPEVQVLSTEAARAIVIVSVCLADTFHSQGFAPSQWFDPAQALWLCFAPLPPVGHRAFRALLRVSSRRISRCGMLSRRPASRLPPNLPCGCCLALRRRFLEFPK